MKLRSILRKLSYQIELVTQLVVVISAGAIYGVMESKFIKTEAFDLPVMGHFSYYHVGLLLLMTVVSFSLALSHIQHILSNRKKYMLLMALGSVPLALLVEDVTWFLVRLQPIGRGEWTMIAPGWGINLGFTWIPLWYIVVIAFSVAMFWIAGRLAEKGYQEFLARRKNHHQGCPAKYKHEEGAE